MTTESSAARLCAACGHRATPGRHFRLCYVCRRRQLGYKCGCGCGRPIQDRSKTGLAYECFQRVRDATERAIMAKYRERAGLPSLKAKPSPGG